jgi:hypothetical protein
MSDLFTIFVDFAPTNLRGIEKQSELMEADRGYAINRRRRYLVDQLIFWTEVAVDDVTWEVLCVQMTDKIIDELAKLSRDLRWRNKPKTDSVTPEMVDIAKTYPVTNLIDFGRGNAGKVHAFCHEDKTPSMFYGKRKGTAQCPVCNKGFDAIAILIERDGLKFHDAVRVLCQGQ